MLGLAKRKPRKRRRPLWDSTSESTCIRRSTTIVRMAEDGEVLGTQRFVSQPFELAQAMAAAGPEPEVVLESTYGWYWAADVLQELGAHVHLAHALGNNWGNRRVKNDVRDAQDLAAMLALGRLAEGWIAPPEVRELRELVRYRYSLIRHRTSAKAQIHGVMAKNGILPVVGELWGPTGQAQLDRLELPEAYAMRLDSLRTLLDVYETAIAELDAHIHAAAQGRPRVSGPAHACPGSARSSPPSSWPRSVTSPASSSAKKLCSWAGLTPKHRESDEVVHRGSDHQAGLTAGPLGGHRGCRQLPGQGQREATRRLPAHRRTRRQVQGPSGRRPQAAHPRLLRDARRGGPMPRVRRLSLGHGPTRARLTPWPTDSVVWPSFLIEPVGTWPNPIMCGDRRMNGWLPTGA